MKPYLLIAGDHYYPQSGTEDWIGTYETIEEINKLIKKIPFLVKNNTIYMILINNKEYDWYEIVDLREWMTGNKNNI